MILINSSIRNTMGIFKSFFPVYVPIGIGYLLAVAESHGINIYFVDEQITDDPLSIVKSHVKNIEKPYIFGFSVLTSALKPAIELGKKIKVLYPDSIIVFGGIHPTAMPEEILTFDHIDVAVRGESEKTLIEFYKCVKEGKSYSHLDGLSYKSDGRIIHNQKAQIIRDLDALPSFPYHRFPLRNYNLSFVVTSRGCPYGCIFCSNRITTGRVYRYRSSEYTIEELELIFNKYGVRTAFFVDDNFLVNHERLYKLMELLKSKGLHKKMTFSFQGRADNAKPVLLKELFDTGFRSIDFGLETASERLMQVINKGETVKQCIEAIRAAKKIGYHVTSTLIYSLPTETHQDRMDAIKLAKKLDIDVIKFNNATPYPGTALYEIAKKENRLKIQGLYENFNSVSVIIENPFKKIPLSYVPQGNTEQEIRTDILFSYLVYWLNLGRVKKLLTKPAEGQGWFNTGEDFMTIIKKVPPLLLLLLSLATKFSELLLNILMKRYSSITIKDIKTVFGFGKKSD